jgi:hypothetical protein
MKVGAILNNDTNDSLHEFSVSAKDIKYILKGIVPLRKRKSKK